MSRIRNTTEKSKSTDVANQAIMANKENADPVIVLNLIKIKQRKMNWISRLVRKSDSKLKPRLANCLRKNTFG